MGTKRCRGAACCAPTCAPTHLPRAETAPANQYPGFCVISALASICVCGIGIRTSVAGLGQVPVVTSLYCQQAVNAPCRIRSWRRFPSLLSSNRRSRRITSVVVTARSVPPRGNGRARTSRNSARGVELPVPPASSASALMRYISAKRNQAKSLPLFCCTCFGSAGHLRSEEHTSELQSQSNLVCRLLLEKKKKTIRHGAYD